MAQNCRVKCVKYLSLMVDQKLKWIDHIAHVKHKVAHGLGIINKAKHFVNQKKPQELVLFVYIHIFHLWCGSLGSCSNLSYVTSVFTSK